MVLGQPGQPTLLPAETCSGSDWCLVRGRGWSVRQDGTSVYAVGSPGILLVWQAEAWTTYGVPTSAGVSSAAVGVADDLWVTDWNGAAFRFDGTGWFKDDTTRALSGLVRTADGALFASAQGPLGGPHRLLPTVSVVRRDDSDWREPFPPLPFCHVGSVLPVSRDEVWASGLVCPTTDSTFNVVLRSRDGQWEEVGREKGNWPDRLLLVGGSVRHTGLGAWTGSGWRQVPEPVRDPTTAPWVRTGDAPLGCSEVLRIDDREAWCGGADRIFRWRAGTWNVTTQHPSERTQPARAFGTMPTTVWAGGDTTSAWGTGPDDVFRTRYDQRTPVSEHFDGTAWSPMTLEGSVWGVDSAGSEVWAGSGSGLFLRDGQMFRKVATLDAPGGALRVLAPGRVVVVTGAAVLEYDGAFRTLRTIEPGWAVVDLAVRGETLVVAEREGGRSLRRRIVQRVGDDWVELNRGEDSASTSLAFWGDRLVVGSGYFISIEDGEMGVPRPERGGAVWTDDSTLWSFSVFSAYRRSIPAGW
jgi:hypothetical protein